MLAESLRMLVKHLLEWLTEHGSLSRDYNAAGHLDEHLIATDILCGHAPGEAVLSRPEKHRVLDFRMSNSIRITPCKESVIFFFKFLILTFFEPIFVKFSGLSSLTYTFYRIEK